MADGKKDAFKADQERIAKENAEQVARTDGFRPTPTQEENDRAKLGVESLKELDNKDSDGSDEQPDAGRVAGRVADHPSKR